MAWVDWCKCSFGEVGFCGGSVSTEMPGLASTERVGGSMDRNARRGTIEPKLVAPLKAKDPYRSIFIFKYNNHAF